MNNILSASLEVVPLHTRSPKKVTPLKDEQPSQHSLLIFTACVNKLITDATPVTFTQSYRGDAFKGQIKIWAFSSFCRGDEVDPLPQSGTNTPKQVSLGHAVLFLMLLCLC